MSCHVISPSTKAMNWSRKKHKKMTIVWYTRPYSTQQCHGVVKVNIVRPRENFPKYTSRYAPPRVVNQPENKFNSTVHVRIFPDTLLRKYRVDDRSIWPNQLVI